ncbi:MAG: ACT domain-containing protein [Alphaproteobacteria bacterium]|nr:ACT domain-containing protein [Alphaproteobacteria bacterium]
MSGGETKLEALLTSMEPVLQDGVYVFHSSDMAFEDAARLDPVLIFREAEGTALILRRETAERAGLGFTYPARMITLNVHSSLEAVGFLAAITRALAAAGVSVNPVSAHFHDHLFVPEDKADTAMRVLEGFARSNSSLA